MLMNDNVNNDIIAKWNFRINDLKISLDHLLLNVIYFKKKIAQKKDVVFYWSKLFVDIIQAIFIFTSIVQAI